MSLTQLFEDPRDNISALSGAQSREISTEVIDAINREFPPDQLKDPDPAGAARVNGRIHTLVQQATQRRGLTLAPEIAREIAGELARRLLGLGFLDLLLPPARTDLSEITVYSSGLVQLMKKGSVRWETVDLTPTPEEINRVLDRLLGPQNRSLNETNPSVNARLARTGDNPGGGRIKALHPVIVPPGRNPSINIRLFEQKPVQPAWLLEKQMMTQEMMADLARAMQNGMRLLITGGTRTGKTTLLSALCSFLPSAWRILKIEDPEEIWIDRVTVQTIEARPQAVGTEVKPYSLADGVDDAMRMSPDYLIIGEVRDGKAAQALFRALMTGHGGACTFHADSPHEAAGRLAVLLGADAGVAKADALQMVADAVDLVVQIGIRAEARRVTQIARVLPGGRESTLTLDPLWVFDESSSRDLPGWIRRSDLKLTKEVV
jgi:pilus assembly protein CpaF